MSRTFAQYNALTQPAAAAARTASPTATDAMSVFGHETAAYPNPFTTSTTLSYYLDKDGPVSVEIFNNYGRKVKTVVGGTEAAGSHQVPFEAGSLPKGTYLFKLTTGGTTTTKRLVVE